jgi:hypothetical protein
MEVDGVGSAKDFKLWPGGGRAWDWNETGTRHEPGVQPADVEELVEHGVRVVVLSRGQELQLHISQDTLNELKARGIEVHVEETRAAVERYNDLAEQGVPVGGLFHSTC